MPAGRPLKFKSLKKLKQKIDEYFTICDEGELIEYYDKKSQSLLTYTRKIPYTITGLALHLGTNRQTLVNYEIKEEFIDTIKDAKLKCENCAELKLMTGDIAPAGAIFALKNYGWKDTQEIENTLKGDPDNPIKTENKWTIEFIEPKPQHTEGE